MTFHNDYIVPVWVSVKVMIGTVSRNMRLNMQMIRRRKDNLSIKAPIDGEMGLLDVELGQSAEAVIIPRGSFFQNTGGKWIYVMSQDGTKAVKRSIKVT